MVQNEECIVLYITYHGFVVFYFQSVVNLQKEKKNESVLHKNKNSNWGFFFPSFFFSKFTSQISSFWVCFYDFRCFLSNYLTISTVTCMF